jgi:hypothetical protein
VATIVVLAYYLQYRLAASVEKSRAAVLRRSERRRFSSASDDEDGGNPANIAASGASNQTLRDCASGFKSKGVR